MSARRSVLTILALAAGVLGTSANAANLELRPVRASGVQGTDWFLGPGANEITLASAGQDVEVELFISEWGPVVLGAYFPALDCSTFDSDDTGSLQTVNAHCYSAPPGAFCNGVDDTRPDWIFAGVPNYAGPCGSSGTCPDGVSQEWVCGAQADPGVSDPGVPRYAATYALHVPAGSTGTFAVAVQDDEGDSSTYPTMPVAPVPALIAVSEQSVCGDNVRDGAEQCDGTDDAACPGFCQQDCTCPGDAIPTVSEWGLVILMLSLLVGIKLKFGRHPAPEPR